MPIAFKCQRCGKTYRVNDAVVGHPVQCSQCRFITVVPNADGTPAARPLVASSGGGAIQEALAAAAEMEQTASRFEKPVILRRPWYKPWAKVRMGPEELPAEPKSDPLKPKADWRLIAIAVIPMLVAAFLLYFLVPWSKFTSTGQPVVKSSEQNLTATPTDHSGTDSSSASTSGGPTSTQPPVTPIPPPHVAPLEPSLPRFEAAKADLVNFGPYVAYNGFAIRGPKSGLHLTLLPRGGITWVGPEKSGITPFLLMNVSPPDAAQADDAGGPGKDRGALGDLVATRLTTTSPPVNPGEPSLTVELITCDSDSKHVSVRIQCAESDSQTLKILRAAAFTLRSARSEDQVLAAGVLPAAYDPAAHPVAWDPDDATMPLLMGKKNATEYAIHPPQGTKNTSPGTWTGDGSKVKLDGVSSSLPLLRIDVQPLAGAEYHTAREWAAAQWSQSGIDAEWGTINGVVFACVRTSETSEGVPMTIEHYVGIADDRFIAVTIADRGNTTDSQPFLTLQTAVRTLKMKSHAAP